MIAVIFRLVAPLAALCRRRTLASGTLAVVSFLVFAAAPSAEAASYTAGDFSAAVNPNVRVFYVDDCRVEVGIVYDWAAYPNYAHVGGVRVNCASQHGVIDATVALYYSDGTRWIQYGSSAYGVRYNSTGSGAGIKYTPRYCVGSLKYNWWMVGTTVRTERAGLTNYSVPVHAADGSGC